MRGQRDIEIAPLSAVAAAPFGTALIFDATSPTSHGEWWRCWEGCVQLSAGRQWVGFVQAVAAMPVVSEMEREPGTEIIIPVTGQIVQVVARGTPGGNGAELPDAGTARAFAIMPGTALMMPAGVWHAAAFGVGGDASYFYVAERRGAEDSEGRGGWVGFADGIQLRPRFPLSDATLTPRIRDE